MTRRDEWLSPGTAQATRLVVDQGEPVQVTSRVTAFAVIEFTYTPETDGYEVAGRLVLDDPPSRYITDAITVRRLPAGRPDSTSAYIAQRDRVLKSVGQPPTRRRKTLPLPAGREVTAEGLRTVQLDRLVNDVLHTYGTVDPFDYSWMDSERGAELRAAGLGDETALRYVADLYLSQSLRGMAPAGAVCVYLDCSAASAGRWIAAAKDAGYLKTADTRRR
jgi:hypothetical protein